MNTIIAYQPNNRVILFKGNVMTDAGLNNGQVSFWVNNWLTGESKTYHSEDIVAKWTIKLK